MEISFEQFLGILKKADNQIKSKVAEGLNEIAEDLLAASQSLAPIEEGDLIASGSVDPANPVNNQLVARVGYSSGYALRRHEDIYNLGELSAQKPNFDGMKVGRKYLQRPLQKYENKYAEHLRKKMEEVL